MPRHFDRLRFEDYLKIIQEHEEKGLTYEKIAQKRGITRQRVEQIFRRGKELQRLKDVDPFWGLPVRAIKVFSNLGLKTRDEVIEAIQTLKLHPFNIPENYGWVTHDKVREWVGLPKEGRIDIMVACPKCKHRFHVG